VETGKKVMAAAASHLIPVVLELGGKDPMIVFEDAPFERAVEGAVYGAFCNAGQVCVSTERLYVQENLHDKFVAALVARTNALKNRHDHGRRHGPAHQPPPGGHH
jgi:acyl-CoA reductase-like NAD-dependent aldehyde dehydrogenase